MLLKALWINWTFLNFIITRGYALFVQVFNDTCIHSFDILGVSSDVRSVLIGSLTDDLSESKFANQYRTSSACQSCVANKAVDRDIQTCAMMKDIGTTSNDRSTWWYVDLGGKYNLYNIRIQFKDYGEMYSERCGPMGLLFLCVSNTTDRHSGYLCYKDGPELPPLDFNTNCITHGRYIIFYNERIPGTIYPLGYETSTVFTELCEVRVTGCSSSGVYGENCDKVCPETCQNRRCDIINGTCLGCIPGWLGARCDKACFVGYYGLQCESKCVGHCKDSVGCNHTNGKCDNGCDVGWTGSNCNKVCPMGTFGPDCVHKCSGVCFGDFACNRTTGKCDTGCDIGYTGVMCDTGCEIGTFGKGCSYQCRGHCLNNVPCNSTTGHCDSGCAPGYAEPFCNKSCEIGKYGKVCSNQCSGNCLDNVPSNPTTGHCDSGCDSGYVEPFCNKTDLESNALRESCNEQSYIAGLSVLFIICITLGSVCLFLMW